LSCPRFVATCRRKPANARKIMNLYPDSRFVAAERAGGWVLGAVTVGFWRAGDESSSNRFESARQDTNGTAPSPATAPSHQLQPQAFRTRREAKGRVWGRPLPQRVQGGARRVWAEPSLSTSSH